MEKKYKLPKDFGENWVVALRSGKYKKATNAYTKGVDCFCALGVGHHVDGCVSMDLGDGEWSLSDFSKHLPCSNIDCRNTGLYYAITYMNDDELKSFFEIADWIEQNVEFI